MRLSSIALSHNSKGVIAYALVTLQSTFEAQSFLGSGEDDIEHNGARLRLKPIAIGPTPRSVCCKIVDQD